jgi:hypothetical protein
MKTIHHGLPEPKENKDFPTNLPRDSNIKIPQEFEGILNSFITTCQEEK